MASAHSLSVRESVIGLRLEGYNMREISRELSISYGSVRDFCHRMSPCCGESCADSSLVTSPCDLLPRYSHCGLQQKAYSLVVIETSLSLKRLHPLWGAARILISLATELSQMVDLGTADATDIEKLPSDRTLDRWFRENNLSKPPRRSGEPTIGRARKVHNIWEVDAKEHLRLQDGQSACYLTMVDEKSGAWLASPVFPLWTHQSSTH